MRHRAGERVTLAVAVVFASLTVVVVRAAPELAFAGASWWLLALEVGCGIALAVSGVAAHRRTRTRAAGPLISLAGIVWLTREWSTPAAITPLMFTLGLLMPPLVVALVAHALLRLGDGGWTRVVIIGYAVTLVLQGFVPNLFFDPQAEGCSGCPSNLLLVHADTSMSSLLTQVGLLAAALWSVAAVLAILARRVAPWHRWLWWPAAGPAVALLGLTAASSVHAVVGSSAATVTDTAWRWEAALLWILAVGLAADRLQSTLMRRTLSRTTVRLARREHADLRTTLADLVGDPALRLVFPTSDGQLVDTAGQVTELTSKSASTTLTRDGVAVAYVCHRPGALDNPTVLSEIANVAGLSLDHERFGALATAHLASLQTSRARIVARRDTERRRLERDLHDGAQQAMVSLILAIRIAMQQASDEPRTQLLLQRCADEVATALSDLRSVAHGLYPAALNEEGLGSALQELAESTPVVLDDHGLGGSRLPTAVESTAYFVTRSAVQQFVRGSGRIDLWPGPDRLRVEVVVDAYAGNSLTDLEDRVGALAGRITVSTTHPDAAVLTLDLPCG